MSSAATGQTENADLGYSLGCADFFRLMSMFYLNPTTELAQGLLDKSITDDMQAIFKDAGVDPSKAAVACLDEIYEQGYTTDSLRAKLRQDYTALFTHPKEPLISPYEMQFRDLQEHRDMPSTLFLNEAALHAEQCYRDAGLVLSDANSREPGDHIAIELEFMAYLHTQLACALDENDPEAQERWKQALAGFMPHLESWGISFFAACENSACGIVYPWLGKVGTAFLTEYFAKNAS